MKAFPRSYLPPILLFLGVYLFSGLGRVATSYDSRWTVDKVMSLWNHADTNLDEYSAAIRRSNFYQTECVDASGHVRMGPPEACEGHWYDLYPIGSTILSAPFIWLLVGVIRLLHPLFDHLHPADPVIAGFLHGNYQLGHALIEEEVASFFLACTAVMVFFISKRYLPERRSILLALLFATGTSAYSIAGRALWQHTPSMLLLAIIVYLLLRAEERPELAAWAGIPVALSYTVRPTDALFVILFTAYVAVHHRKFLWRYLLAAAPIAAVWLAYNVSIYHWPFSPYYQSNLNGFRPSLWPSFGMALAGNLISPSRGLFVFTPVFLFSAWNMLRGKWKTPLAPWLAGLALLHWIAVSSYVEIWWGGHSYGPRFFTDLTPVLALFLIPFIAAWDQQSRKLRALFLALALAGVFIHVRGGWSPAVWAWNATPLNVDAHPDRVWDWSDPQFLR